MHRAHLARLLPGAEMRVRMSKPVLLQGVAARQYDAFDLGITTTDVFGAADVLYDQTLPAVRAALTVAPAGQPHVPVVTGFLGRGTTTGGPSPALPSSPSPPRQRCWLQPAVP